MITPDIPPAPDGLFWYSLSTVLVLALIWVLQRYVSKTDKLFEKIIHNQQQLLINDKVQDTRLDDLESPSKIVRYRHNGN
jgi:hypothetical protein